MSDLAILKTFWNRRNDGVWQIIAMKGIDLKPQGQSETDHFAIEDNIVPVQHPVMIGTVNSFLGESIVPVVAAVTGENTLRCVGTGFFISCSGLLITAAHVLTDPIDSKYGDLAVLDDLTVYARKVSLGVLIPNNPVFQQPGHQFYPIEWAMFLAERREDPLQILGLDLRLNSDIAICKIPLRPNG